MCYINPLTHSLIPCELICAIGMLFQWLEVPRITFGTQWLRHSVTQYLGLVISVWKVSVHLWKCHTLLFFATLAPFVFKWLNPKFWCWLCKSAFTWQCHCNQYIYTHIFYTRLMSSFQDNLDKPVPERQNQSGFKWCKRIWGFRMAVVSAVPYAKNLHLAADR